MNKTWLVIETFVHDAETIIAACSSEEKARELALTYRDKFHPWGDSVTWKTPKPEWNLGYYAMPKNEQMLYATSGHSSWADADEIHCYLSIRSILTDQLFGISPSQLDSISQKVALQT